MMGWWQDNDFFDEETNRMLDEYDEKMFEEE